MRAAGLVAAASLAGCGMADRDPAVAEPTVAGAGFTTFDASAGGCLNRTSGARCNTYARADQVYLAVGAPDPTTAVATAALADGTYFFAVLAPGSQRAGFLEGEAVDGDFVANRAFVVAGGQIVAYAGTHAVGETLDGRPALGVAPFDATDDGVHILAICAVGATDPAQCAYDAFRVLADGSGPLPRVHGGVFYDANLDGAWDSETEPGLPGWRLDYHDMISASVETGVDGRFTLELIPAGYLFVARPPTTGTWLDTRSIARGAGDLGVWVEALDAGSAGRVDIGYVCVGPGGVQASPATCPSPF